MRDIQIQINKAKLLSYSATLSEDKPEITGTIGLFSGEKQISTFSLTTRTWMSESIKFELDPNLILAIKEIADQLERILVTECNRSMKMIGGFDA